MSEIKSVSSSVNVTNRRLVGLCHKGELEGRGVVCVVAFFRRKVVGLIFSNAHQPIASLILKYVGSQIAHDCGPRKPDGRNYYAFFRAGSHCTMAGSKKHKSQNAGVKV